MTRDDIRALRIPLIVLAAGLVASLSLILVSGSIRESAEHTRVQREAELRQARMRIQNAGEEKEMIAKYLAGYQELARAGFVGDEQRINWLDSLRLANEEARMFGVEYDIGAQKPYVYAAEYNAGKLVLQESIMRLRFRLLHEEDLPRFFHALARRGGGFFTVEQCYIRRLRSGELNRTAQIQSNLSAECDLRWLTVKAPAGEKKG